ncbi:MAG: NAD(P)-dependent oxidoreductase, partial [Calditrichaeota bacterium]
MAVVGEKSSMPLAVLGTGILGSAIARRLLEAGYPLVVYNRTRRKAEALAALGARVADSPAQAIEAAEAVLVVLTDGPAVEQVLFQSRPELQFKNKLIIQTSTILPEENRRFAERIKQAGGRYLEAPVLGSVPEARERRLIVMAAGPEQLFQEARPVLETLGPDPVYVGPYGQAAALK